MRVRVTITPPPIVFRERTDVRALYTGETSYEIDVPYLQSPEGTAARAKTLARAALPWRMHPEFFDVVVHP